MKRIILAVPALVLTLAFPGMVTAQADSNVPACWVRGERADLELRASPYDSASVDLAPGPVKVCYSRPRKLGRPIMGRLVPHGEPWRLGANEATAIHMPAPGTIAGIPVDAGWYSLYAVPDEDAWEIVVNRTVRRWGIPIDPAVRADDVGSSEVPVESTERPVDLMTARFDRRTDTAAELVIEWDRTRVRIPVSLTTP